MALKGSVTEHVEVGAPEAFALVTDVERLPEWNRIIQRVVEPPGSLEPDAEWLVELSAMGSTWRSRATVVERDVADLRFSYRSRTDDGNPSFADWSWQIDGDDAGADVTVSWDLHPRTFWRRVLLGPVRNRQLRREVRESVRSLAQAASSSPTRTQKGAES